MSMRVHTLYCEAVTSQSMGEFASGNLAVVSAHIYPAVIIYQLQCLNERSGWDFRLKTIFATYIVWWTGKTHFLLYYSKNHKHC